MRLRPKITVLLLLLSMIPFILIGVMAYYEGEASLRKSLGSHFQYVARNMMDSIESYIHELSQNMSRWTELELMRDVVIHDVDGRIISFLSNVQKEQGSSFHSLDVLDSSGEVIASSVRDRLDRNFAHEAFFEEAVRGALYVSDMAQDEETGNGGMVFAFPIWAKYNTHETIGGVLKVDWKAEELSRLLRLAVEKDSGFSSGHMMLMRKDGLVIAATQPMQEMVFHTNLIQQEFESAKRIKQKKEGFLVERERAEGKSYLIGYSASRGRQDGEGLGWGMLVIQDTAQAFTAIHRLQFAILGIGLFVVLCVILIALKISQGIARPVLHIAGVAQEIAAGNLDKQVDYDSSDELGSLAASFNQMIRDLKEHREKLVMEKHKLEQLLSIDTTLHSILDLNHLVDFVIDKTMEILEAQRCSLMLLDPESQELLIRGAKGLDTEIIKTTRLRMGEGVAGKVAQNGAPILVTNIEEETLLERPSGAVYKTKSFMSAPIKVQERIVGVINVADKKAGQDSVFTPTDLKILCTIVRQATIAIENADYYRKLEHLSMTDSLTGIFNHRYFIQVLDQEIARAKRYPKPLCLLMFDIDDFKSYNDFYGHLEGDRLLRDIGQHLKENLRSVDIVCRYAGDEFVVVLPETDIPDAQIIADKMKMTFKNFKYEREVTISIGIAKYSANMDRRDLIMKADQALYQAKRSGKNRVSFFY